MFPSESSSEPWWLSMCWQSPHSLAVETRSLRESANWLTSPRHVSWLRPTAVLQIMQFSPEWLRARQARKCSLPAAESCDWLCVIYSYLFVSVRHYLTPSLFQVVHQLWRNDLLASKKIFPAHKYFYPPVQCTTETLYFIYNQLFTKFQSCSSNVLRFNLINNSVAQCKKFNTSNHYRI